MSPGKPSSTGAAARRATVSHPANSSYWGIVSQAITKIKDEPFLFVIALVALLIGFTVVASKLGSPDLRFIVAVIAVLAFTVIVGHYLKGMRPPVKLSGAKVVGPAAASAGDRSLAERDTSAARPQEPAPIQPPPIGIAPPVPRLFIGREQCLRELKQRLGVAGGKTGRAEMQPVTIIRGTPGVGKTTSAAALAHDGEVKQAFPDGIVWTSLGQNPEVLSKLALWGRVFGSEDLLHAATQDDAITQIRNLLKNKRALLIADDVWEALHGEPFLRARGEKCAVILTTRMSFAASGLTDNAPGAIYHLPELTEQHALELLNAVAPEVCSKFPKQTGQLVKRLGGLPLLILVAGRLLNLGYHRGWRVSDLFAELCDRPSGSSKLLDSSVPSDRMDLAASETTTVTALLKTSTDHLDERTRKYFARLGSFPAPATFDLEDMQVTWQLSNPRDAEAIANTLIDHGLVEPLGDGRFQMHALLVMYAKSLQTPQSLRSA
jgi:hypothetical protein